MRLSGVIQEEKVTSYERADGFKEGARRPGRSPAVGMVLAALVLPLAGLFAPDAQAQTVTLISNVGQGQGATVHVPTTQNKAQGFKTGTNSLGYTLSSVEFVIGSGTANTVAVSVCSADSNALKSTPGPAPAGPYPSRRSPARAP